MNAAASPDSLADELERERERFHERLARLSAAERERADLVGSWGVRELVAHLGYWAGNAGEAIHRVVVGDAETFGSDDDQTVDEVNATVARVARATPLANVMRREAAAADALAGALRALDPALLATRLPDGGTLEEQVRVDGPDHYRGHADELPGR